MQRAVYNLVVTYNVEMLSTTINSNSGKELFLANYIIGNHMSYDA